MSHTAGVPVFQQIVNEFLHTKFTLMGRKLSDEKITELGKNINPEAIIAWYINTKKKKEREDDFYKDLENIIGTTYLGLGKKTIDIKSSAFSILQSFSQKGYIKRMYTTNFDFLVEKCFGNTANAIYSNPWSRLR